MMKFTVVMFALLGAAFASHDTNGFISEVAHVPYKWYGGIGPAGLVGGYGAAGLVKGVVPLYGGSVYGGLIGNGLAGVGYGPALGYGVGIHGGYGSGLGYYPYPWYNYGYGLNGLPLNVKALGHGGLVGGLGVGVLGGGLGGYSYSSLNKYN
ncbi:shematrin-like protein 2 [Sabethes cyaneus]|uniref:shematrin-like protein 2 n=1 Tax=Sabethes cyaneus TaxID=53552 RepID=UPI00237D9D8C|nr:shematrin-like protein 2 [Sabethes cyaneus]XP_053686759.1 shematrin-like protein 2 [Sabethes cyaneus]